MLRFNLSSVAAVLVSVTALLVVASCLAVPIPRRLAGEPGGSLGWKVVVEKRAPNLVLSVDRQACEVGGDRFESIRPGDRIFCHWR